MALQITRMLSPDSMKQGDCYVIFSLNCIFLVNNLSSGLQYWLLEKTINIPITSTIWHTLLSVVLLILHNMYFCIHNSSVLLPIQNVLTTEVLLYSTNQSCGIPCLLYLSAWSYRPKPQASVLWKSHDNTFRDDFSLKEFSSLVRQIFIHPITKFWVHRQESSVHDPHLLARLEIDYKQHLFLWRTCPALHYIDSPVIRMGTV